MGPKTKASVKITILISSNVQKPRITTGENRGTGSYFENLQINFYIGQKKTFLKVIGFGEILGTKSSK